ncbi:MAG: hypothetical protein GY696_19340 [Gammaproteobacteria bacterium]|nr:hypothetical protein [Gammaproteobacteria bacterium]
MIFRKKVSPNSQSEHFLFSSAPSQNSTVSTDTVKPKAKRQALFAVLRVRSLADDGAAKAECHSIHHSAEDNQPHRLLRGEYLQFVVDDFCTIAGAVPTVV